MKKIIIILIATIGTVLFLSTFIEKENTSDTEKKESIKVAMYNIPTTLKEVGDLSVREQDIICATSIGLVEKNNDGKIMMSLAKEVTKRENEIEYEFIFSDEVKWSNGEKITPNDYILYLKEIIKTAKEENIKGLLSIYGARDYREGKVTFEKGVAISHNKEKNSIVIRLNNKDDSFIEELSKPQYRLRKNLIMWDNIRNDYSKLLYSGTYSITYMDREQIKLTSNDEEKRTIEFTREENAELAMASFEIKERDLVLDPPKNELDRLESENKLYSAPHYKSIYAFLNEEKEGFSLPLRREVYKSLNKAMKDYINTNQNYYDLAEGRYYREDEDDLNKLQIKKASINSDSEVKMPNIITILAEDTSDNRDICEYIYSWMKENKGIEVRFTLVKGDEIKDLELRKRYNIILTENRFGHLNRNEFLQSVKSYLSKDLAKIIDSENYNITNVEDKLYDSCTLVPLLFYRENIALSEKVQKAEFDGYGNINFKSLK